MIFSLAIFVVNLLSSLTRSQVLRLGTHESRCQMHWSEISVMHKSTTNLIYKLCRRIFRVHYYSLRKASATRKCIRLAFGPEWRMTKPIKSNSNFYRYEQHFKFHCSQNVSIYFTIFWNAFENADLFFFKYFSRSENALLVWRLFSHSFMTKALHENS